MPEHLTEHAAKNRRDWDAGAEGYQRQHGPQLAADMRPCWGVWQIPDAELGVLGDVKGRDVLELGCGGGQMAAKLARAGAHVTAVDLSEGQLEHARDAAAEAGVAVRLVHASAEDLPLPDASFDIAISDHGAMSFCEPGRSVPEAARVLRDHGLFAFNVPTPWLGHCVDPQSGRPGDRLHGCYFERHRLEDEHSVEFRLGYGEWIRLLRDSGFTVEDLVEPRPAEGASTSFDYFVQSEWARTWPAENIWKATKGAIRLAVPQQERES